MFFGYIYRHQTLTLKSPSLGPKPLVNHGIAGPNQGVEDGGPFSLWTLRGAGASIAMCDSPRFLSDPW